MIGGRWGATDAEVTEPLACDALVPAGTTFVRAVDVAAPATLVFRWMRQLEFAPYSYDWLDNRGRRSPQHLREGIPPLEVGQRMVAVFRLASFVPGRELTLVSDGTVLGDVAMTYRVTVVTARRSRLVCRIVWRAPVAHRLLAPAMALGDLVMARRQLLNLKALAERDAARDRGTSEGSAL